MNEALKVLTESGAVSMEQITEAVKRWQQAYPTLYEAMITIKTSFSGSLNSFSEVSAKLDEFRYQAACKEYRRQNGRLPGSERTKRLRKKRRSKVMKWHMKNMAVKTVSARKEGMTWNYLQES